MKTYVYTLFFYNPNRIGAVMKKWSTHCIALFFCASIMLSLGCIKKADNYQQFAVNFEWSGGGLSSPNPEITITNPPAGTGFFKVQMTDLDMTSFDHGGGTVPCTVKNGIATIEQGSLKGYRGPEPPMTQRHQYMIKVFALNMDQTLVLGEGKAVRSYPH